MTDRSFRPPRAMQEVSHYTFGDSELAGLRLERLAAAYREPSRAFLAEAGPKCVGHAFDLGCGLGYTTRLVHETLAARHTTGIDSSERYVALARASAPAGIDFFVHDLSRPLAVCSPADALFCRFFLTHVAEPSRVLSASTVLARRGARLLVQEAASLRAEHPVLKRYYELVAALQAHYGQSLYIGSDLERLASSTPWTVVSFGVRKVEQPACVMAELHALNLRTWRGDPFAAEQFDSQELAQLVVALERIARGHEPAAPVVAGLGELVLEIR
jgi:SAM-dependent methyltransferase